jgi:hypothetical protein
MYTIIGSDGNQYGPITAEQLRQWAQEGRVTADTQVQSDGGAWKPLSAYPEFGQPTAAVMPGVTATTAMPSLPQPSAATGETAKTSGMAITALVLGVTTLLCSLFTALPSIILGFISMGKIKRSGGTLKGRGLALAGVIVSLAILLLQGSVLILVALKAKEGVHIGLCSVKVASLTQACSQYARAHEDTLPSSLDELKPYLGDMAGMDLFACPAQKDASAASYEIVGAGQKVDWQKASETPVIRETGTRHMQVLLVGYLDGRIADKNSGEPVRAGQE